jgi:hypothetical protein
MFRLLTRSLVPGVADTQCGFKFFRREIVQTAIARARYRLRLRRRTAGADPARRRKDRRAPRRLDRLPWWWTDDLAAKPSVIAGYRTQVEALFPDGRIPVQPETYYARRR